MSELIGIITAASNERRNRPLDGFCQGASVAQLVAEAAALDRFRRESDNLYERVRAQFFLYSIHRFHLPYKTGVPAGKPVPPEVLTQILQRRFHEAIDALLEFSAAGPTAAAIRTRRRRWQQQHHHCFIPRWCGGAICRLRFQPVGRVLLCRKSSGNSWNGSLVRDTRAGLRSWGRREGWCWPVIWTHNASASCCIRWRAVRL